MVPGELGLLSMPSVRFLRSSMSVVLLALLSIVTLALSVTGGSSDSARCTVDPSSQRESYEKLSILVVSLGIYQLPRGLVVLAHELVARGHSVTITVPTSSLKSAQTAFGRAVLVVPVADNVNVEQLTRSLMSHKHIMAPTRGLLAVATELAVPLSRPMSRGLHRYLANPKTKRPDVIVADVLAIAAVDIAERHDIPLVLNHPGTTTSLSRTSFSLPVPGAGYPRRLTASMQLLSWLGRRMLLFALLPSFAQINADRSASGLRAFSEPTDIWRRHVVLLNTEQRYFDLPRSLPPTLSAVGPLVQATGDPLPSSKLKLISDRKVVVVHLGPAFLEVRELEHVMSALDRRSARFKVWWVVRPGTPANVPNSFVVGDISLVPSILSHKSVVAALVPCSAENVQEIFYHGKPVACIAVSADQNDVAQRLIETGAGRRVQFAHRSPASLAEAAVSTVEAILDNQAMNHSAFYFGKALRLSDGVKLASDTVEEAALYGTDRLVKGQSDFSYWHERMSFDVYSVYASLTIVSLALIRYTFIWISFAVHFTYEHLAHVPMAMDRMRASYRQPYTDKEEEWPECSQSTPLIAHALRVGTKLGILKHQIKYETDGSGLPDDTALCPETRLPPSADVLGDPGGQCIRTGSDNVAKSTLRH